MAANTSPIFTLSPDIQWAGPIQTANTALDGTGTVFAPFTADATNGGFVQRVRFRSLGTNVLSVGRVFINNGSTNTVAANNTLWDEMTLPATAASAVAALQIYELTLNFALPPGYRLLATIGTTVAAGYQVGVIGGKY